MIHVHAAGTFLQGHILFRQTRQGQGKAQDGALIRQGAAADAAGMAESSRRSTIQTHTNRFIITHSFLSSRAPYRDTPGG